MSNWYKIARRGTGRDLATEYSENGGKPDDELGVPKSLTKAIPMFGGNERSTSDGNGYPKGISQNEDYDFKKDIGTDQIPAGRTILDDGIFNGEGANDNRFVDPIDVPFNKKNDPVGAFNMQGKNIFEDIYRKSRKNRVPKL